LGEKLYWVRKEGGLGEGENTAWTMDRAREGRLVFASKRRAGVGKIM
jgi:hypothetical protein